MISVGFVAPRAHLVRYHGLLAPRASGRDWIIPVAEPEPSAVAVPVGMGEAGCGQSELRTQEVVGFKVRLVDVQGWGSSSRSAASAAGGKSSIG